MWQKLSWLMEKLRLTVVSVWHVQRVLAKKRDPLTHVLFIDECLGEDSPLPSEQIWYARFCHSCCQALESWFVQGASLTAVVDAGNCMLSPWCDMGRAVQVALHQLP